MSRLLQDMLSLEKVAIWFWDEETTQFESATTLTESTSLPFAIHLPTGLNLTYSQPHRLGEEKNHVSIWLKTFINVQEWSVAIPLGIDRPNGLILLGPRTDDEIFDERDFTILTLMARQATLFVFAAQVTYWLDKAQEDERFRIAQDLHDTIQQSLNAVSIHLHMIQKMVHYDVEHSALFALECQTDIKDAIRNLYEIRRSLDPSELAHGLIGPIKLAAERAKRVRGLDTHIVASPEVDDQLSPTARRAMYRMVKQALDNTLNHANASNFNIQTSDGFQIGLDVSILYHITDPYKTLSQYGLGRNYQDNGLLQRAEPTLKSTLGIMNPEDFFNTKLRVQKQNEARNALDKEFSDKGIAVDQILIRFPHYNPVVQQKIEERNLQEQTRYMNITAAAEAEAQGRLTKVIEEGKAAVSIVLTNGANYITRKTAEMEKYDRIKRSEADKLKNLAEAEKNRLINEAYQGIGSERIVAMEMAEVLKGLDYIMVPAGGKSGFNPLDLQSLSQMLQLNQTGGKTNEYRQ